MKTRLPNPNCVIAAFVSRRACQAARLFAIVAALLVSGCLPSLNPLFTEKDLIEDPDVLGIWAERESSSDHWAFTQLDEKRYRLVITEKGESAPFEVHLLKLGGQRFMDLQPEKAWLEAAKVGELYKSLLVRGHLILRMDETSPSLRLTSLNGDWLAKLLKSDPATLSHSWIEQDRFVITASTKDLQSFILKHLKNAAAWGDPTQFERLSSSGPSTKP